MRHRFGEFVVYVFQDVSEGWGWQLYNESRKVKECNVLFSSDAKALENAMNVLDEAQLLMGEAE